MGIPPSIEGKHLLVLAQTGDCAQKTVIAPRELAADSAAKSGYKSPEICCAPWSTLMRRTSKQPYFSKSWTFALMIGVVFVAAGYGLKFEIESVDNPDARSWLDLALFLCGYLFFFCLKPIQSAIHRRLCRRAFRNDHQKTSS